MQVRVLGCNGGIGDGSGTTSILIDESILIDAGTGIASLTLAEMRKITHIFLTHSHLDHIAGIPFLVDTLFSSIEEPIQIHANVSTIEALQKHIFNWTIWPDFSRLPSKEKPVMTFHIMDLESVEQVGGVSLRSIKVNHVVPTVGYHVTDGHAHFAFSGDTTTTDHFWQVLNDLPKLDVLIVESAFPNADLAISKQAKHYCPSLLAEDLKKLTQTPQIYLTHAKPGDRETIFEQASSLVEDRTLEKLMGGEVFNLK